MTIAELKAQRRWLLWRYEPRKSGKPTKVPYTVTGYRAKSNDATTWSTFHECEAVISRFSGIGLATGDGVVSVDLDDVIADGKISTEGAEIVDAVTSYTETSPSGTGLLILAWGVLPGPGIARPLTADSAVEVKSDGFFHTFTGRHLEGTPLELMDRQAQLETLYHRFRPPVQHAVSDGIPRPGAQEKFVRRFTAYCERVGVAVDAVRQLGDGTVLVQTEFCLLNEDHTGSSCGVGVGPDGVRKNLCKHSGCAMPWAQWSRLVEEKHGPMRLDGEIKWKK